METGVIVHSGQVTTVTTMKMCFSIAQVNNDYLNFDMDARNINTRSMPAYFTSTKFCHNVISAVILICDIWGELLIDNWKIELSKKGGFVPF